MTDTDSKELEFREAILLALDIPRRTERLEMFKVLLEAEDYFAAGSVLNEEASHLKNISKKILDWEKVSRTEQ